MKWFLVVFDRAQHKILDEREFDHDDRAAAFAARAAAVAEHHRNPDVEAVVFEAESHENLERTHGRYFMTEDEALAELCADDMARADAEIAAGIHGQPLDEVMAELKAERDHH